MKKNKSIKIGILGNGQIGQAICKFYKKPLIKDLNRDDGLFGVDVLHVCIPHNDKFIEIVEKEISQIGPKITIIHSTVAPGTTKKLAEKFSGRVVHSPVRGVHPNLYKGIKTFVKYIGADDKKAGVMAKKHLESLGIKTKLLTSSSATELGKILDTTYYGICIAWHGEMKKVCDKLGVNFNEAVTEFNKTYDEGYTKLGKKNVVRPVLSPPEGFVGGHCIVPNAKILNKFLSSEAIDLVLKYDGGEKSSHVCYRKEPKNKKIIITSGFFNPLHIGHINLIRESKKLGDYLIVIVNNDEQVKIKGAVPFMPEQERVEIIKALRYADDVILSIDTADGYQSKSLKHLANKFVGSEIIFTKGGDRNFDNLPECEKKVCREFNVKVVSNIGGEKVQSSSWLIKKSANKVK